MSEINRIVWMFVFFIGSVIFAWLEWRSGEGSAMGWFMLTSLWSAVCGIAYSLFHLVLQARRGRN